MKETNPGSSGRIWLYCAIVAVLLWYGRTGWSVTNGNVSTDRRPIDLTRATLVLSPAISAQELVAANMLVEEEATRTGVQWDVLKKPSRVQKQAGNRVYLAEVGQLPQLLPRDILQDWQGQIPALSFLDKHEGFTVRTFRLNDTAVIVIVGNDARGVLYGAGYLLRQMELAPNSAMLSHPLSISSAPQVSIRSHQIGYRFKNNTYDAWTLPMFEQQIRDLAVFGISGLQVISPNSDDAKTSPLFPQPALDTVIGISRLLDKYGLDCDLYYPEMRRDYTNPSTVSAELKDFGSLVKAMPRVDALYVPGGDPGHTAPAPLLHLIAAETEVLHRYHPMATVWVSAQGFDREEFAAFYKLLQQQQPTWLTGVFFGPQSRDSFETQRANIPSRYRMLFYPDIGHTMHAQFPVPQWDPIFALTEGREPIDPRPLDETHIYRHFAHLQSGFVTYSEGVNDDINKFLWTRLGWSKDTDPSVTLQEYSRYFLGASIGHDSSDRFAEALLGLEQDWRGSLVENPIIPKTFDLLHRLYTEANPSQRTNWRFESALYRVDYDFYIQQRRRVEQLQEQNALRELAKAPQVGSISAIDSATKALQPAPTAPMLRSEIEDLAGRLYQHVRLQLSVTKYGASAVERGANLDRIDIPLNDRIWMNRRFEQIHKLSGEDARLAALSSIVHWDEPVSGALHDDLGVPDAEPHLVRGVGFAADPELYQTAIDGVADHTTLDGWRLSDLDYAEALYETPLTLHYSHLDPHASYKFRVTYAGEEYTLPVTLVANGNIVLQANRLRKSNPETVEFSIPKSTTKKGSLNLQWSRPAGIGGGGRGRQVAEAWLIPVR